MGEGSKPKRSKKSEMKLVLLDGVTANKVVVICFRDDIFEQSENRNIATPIRKDRIEEFKVGTWAVSPFGLELHRIDGDSNRQRFIPWGSIRWYDSISIPDGEPS